MGTSATEDSPAADSAGEWEESWSAWPAVGGRRMEGRRQQVEHRALEVADGKIAVTMADPDNQKTYTGIGLMTSSKVGRYCWIDFDGEEVGPDGEYTKHAVGDFMHVFGRPVRPTPAPTNISGREGRAECCSGAPAY